MPDRAEQPSDCRPGPIPPALYRAELFPAIKEFIVDYLGERETHALERGDPRHPLKGADSPKGALRYDLLAAVADHFPTADEEAIQEAVDDLLELRLIHIDEGLSSEIGDAVFRLGPGQPDRRSRMRQGPFVVTSEASPSLDRQAIPDQTAAGTLPSKDVAHSDDFTSVVWYGTRYQFSKGQQADSVKALWEAWENGTPTLSENTIREKIGSAANLFRLGDVFRNRKGKGMHPAWGTMIQPAGKGVFQLVRQET